MLKLHKKIAWTGIKGSAITTLLLPYIMEVVFGTR